MIQVLDVHVKEEQQDETFGKVVLARYLRILLIPKWINAQLAALIT